MRVVSMFTPRSSRLPKIGVGCCVRNKGGLCEDVVPYFRRVKYPYDRSGSDPDPI